MNITKVNFYNRDWLVKIKGAKRLCSIKFDNGLMFNDIMLIENSIGELYIKFPSKYNRSENGEKECQYLIRCTNNKLYEQLREAVIDQWHRYTSHWKSDDAIG